MRSGTSIWVLCNCNSRDEARRIGEAVLEERLAGCFDIFSRKLTNYFWPPQSGQIEEGKGALLVVQTLETKYEQVASLIEKIHSDEIPFVGFIPVQGVGKSYLEWLEKEIDS